GELLVQLVQDAGEIRLLVPRRDEDDRVAHERMTASTSSRLRSINSCERASRFRRRSGSVFEGRTLKCQSSASTERPSRCETVPCGPKSSSSSANFAATS